MLLKSADVDAHRNRPFSSPNALTLALLAELMFKSMVETTPFTGWPCESLDES